MDFSINYDELNNDPRETDYFDDYDMSIEINFYELKKQLADLGFVEPQLVDVLRESFINAEQPAFIAGYKEAIGTDLFRAWFGFRKDERGDYQLEQYQALLSGKEDSTDKLFDKDISRNEALAVLRKDLQMKEHDQTLYWPLKRKDLNTYFGQTPDTAAGFKLSSELLGHTGPLHYGDRHEKDGQNLIIELELFTAGEQKHLKKLTVSLINVRIEKNYRNGTAPRLLDRLMDNMDWLEDPYDTSRRSPYLTKRYAQVERELHQLSEGQDLRGR